MTFNDWLTQYQCLRGTNSQLTSEPLRFYHQIQTDLAHKLNSSQASGDIVGASRVAVAYNQASIEGAWYRCHNPYFKIFPDMIRMLVDTDINVPAHLVHAPLRTILYRLPKDHGVKELCDESGAELRCVLVDELDPRSKTTHLVDVADSACAEAEQRRFIFWLDWGEGQEQYRGKQLPVVAFQNVAIADERASFEEALTNWLGKNRLDWDKGRKISDEAILASIRLAVGICLLATNAHSLVEHDVLNRHVERYRATADKQVREQLFEKARKRDKYGWLVGRELVVPRPHAASDGDEHVKRGELIHSHLRRGHFHTVRHGVGRALQRVDWFPPLVVRPDLLSTTTRRGYRTGN